MLFSKYLKPFVIYNFLLLILFSISVDTIDFYNIINLLSYILLHYIFVYLSIYYYRNLNYIIFFVYGLAIDILLINEIGPHILSLMTLLIFLNLSKKFIKSLSSKKMYIIIVLILNLIILFEMVLSLILFNYYFDILYFIGLVIISIFISYPTLLFFKKIDNINK
tara:strand:+ start:85 stop:579 length:495 start_codon:yes stop_codon:yes gene_type:complete